MGKKSPFVVIFPRGGYEIVAVGIEGDSYVKKLNALEHSAFSLYYHIKACAAYDDLARAIRLNRTTKKQEHHTVQGYTFYSQSSRVLSMIECYHSDQVIHYLKQFSMSFNAYWKQVNY